MCSQRKSWLTVRVPQKMTEATQNWRNAHGKFCGSVDVVSVDLTDQQPSTGEPSTSARLTKEEQRMRSKEDRRISLAVEMYDSLEEAADFLAEDPPITAEGDTEFTSLGEIVNALKLNMMMTARS